MSKKERRYGSIIWPLALVAIVLLGALTSSNPLRELGMAGLAIVGGWIWFRVEEQRVKLDELAELIERETKRLEKSITAQIDDLRREGHR